MTRSRRDKINELAETIREEANLSTPLSIEDLEEFVQELGGDVQYDELDDDTDGIIQRDRNSFVIKLNSVNFSTDERRKFTLSHELGHLFLHMKYLDEKAWENSENYEDTTYARSGYSEEEYDANEFAAALLMPRNEFKKIAKKHTKNNVCDVSAVAEHFGVSTDAAINRGKWLGIFQW